MLDEKGKDVMSEQIADLIGDAGNTVCSVLWFFSIFANYMLLKFRLLEFLWENIRLDYIFPNVLGIIKAHILYWWAIWSWDTSTRAGRCNN